MLRGKTVMEYEEFCREVCIHVNGLTGIPVILYETEKEIFRAERFSLPNNFRLSECYFKRLFSESASSIPISYSFFDNILLFCLIKSNTGNYSFLLGPISTCELSEYEIRKFMFECGAEKQLFSVFAEYLTYAPVLSFNYAMQMLSFFYLLINRSILSPTRFVLSDDNQSNTAYAFNEMFSHAEKLQYDEIGKHTSFEFENMMLFYIQNGQTKNLLKLFNETPLGRTGKIAENMLRQEKNSTICALTLATRAAIAGGLNREIAFQLSDITIQKLEYCSSVNDVGKLNYDFMTELCDRVAALQNGGCKNPLINCVIGYIGEHICDRITIEELAKKLRTNRSFLSTKFKSEIGISLNEYINRQKITEAKKLLSYTDKDLSDISNYLSFSSQSHFQNIFKKITGTTPTVYRNSRIK